MYSNKIIESVISGVLREYLDKDIMYPLKSKLDSTPKKYKVSDIEKQWRLYKSGKGKLDIRHAFSEHRLFKNGWVIHFTNKPLSIIKNGFIGIRSDFMSELWRTYGKSTPRTEDGGYSFAYDVNDVMQSGGGINTGYGNYALMFRTSGLKVYNRAGDEEWQVIFNSRQANMKECFMFELNKSSSTDYGGDGEPNTSYKLETVKILNPYTLKCVHEVKSLYDAIEWVKTNARQYKSLNTFNSVSKIREHDAECQRIIGRIVDYIKSNSRGDVSVSRLGDNEIRIAYGRGVKLMNFLEAFGLKKKEGETGYYENEYITVYKGFVSGDDYDVNFMDIRPKNKYI